MSRTRKVVRVPRASSAGRAWFSASAFRAVTLGVVLLLPMAALARDNFLIIIADDVGVDGINIYGEGVAPGPTPNIDQLAAEGILFRHASTNPVCAPTRAEALTGRYGFRTGIGVPESAVLDLDETTIPELLSATHHTAAIGKWHIGDNGDVDHPIDTGFDYYAGGLGGGIGNYELWDKTTNSTDTTGTTQADVTTYATTDAADEAIAKIAEYGEDPWFVWLAFNAAHTPFHVPPPSLTTITVNAGSDNPTKFKAAVEAMDTEIGRVLASIPAPIRADTTVIFIGDNGTPSGASESPFTGPHAKGSLYEGGTNVPLIVTGPRVDALDEGKESQALVSSVDLFATIAEIAGIGAATEDSLSFVPYLEDPTLATSSTRPYSYAERFEPNGFGPYTDEQRAVRDDQYKLVWRNGVYEEFFDLNAFPFETVNLLPVGNLNASQLIAYNALVAAIEGIGDGVATPASSDSEKCRRAINKEVGKYTKQVQKNIDKCKKASMTRGDPLLMPDFANCTVAALKTPGSKIDRASTKLKDGIAKRCGGTNRICEAAPGDGDETLAAIGWGVGSCMNLESGTGTECDNAITDCGGIGTCLECIVDKAVDQAVDHLLYDEFNTASFFPANSSDPEKRINKCQETIAKEGGKFLVTKHKLLNKCWDAKLKGKTGFDDADACPETDPSLGSGNPPASPGDSKTTEKIKQAEQKSFAKICKACGGSGDADKDGICDAVGEPVGGVTITLGDIVDLPYVCPSVSVPPNGVHPGGLDCTNADVDTLQEYVDCISCVLEFKADCIADASVGDGLSAAGIEYAPECNP